MERSCVSLISSTRDRKQRERRERDRSDTGRHHTLRCAPARERKRKMNDGKPHDAGREEGERDGDHVADACRQEREQQDCPHACKSNANTPAHTYTRAHSHKGTHSPIACNDTDWSLSPSASVSKCACVSCVCLFLSLSLCLSICREEDGG